MIVFVALYDPRPTFRTHRQEVRLTKVAVFFVEEPGVDGSLTGRFLRTRVPFYPCGCECTAEGSFLRACP